MVTEEQKDKMGEILFGIIATAMKEVNQHMAFPNWQSVDKETRASYMNVVDLLVAVASPEPLATVEKVIDSEQAFIKAQPIQAGVDILSSILAEQPDKSVTLASIPPKQKVNDRMAKARAAKKANQEKKVPELARA